MSAHARDREVGPGPLENMFTRSAIESAGKFENIGAGKHLLPNNVFCRCNSRFFLCFYTKHVSQQKWLLCICKKIWQKDRPFLSASPYKHSFLAVFGVNTASHEIKSDAELCRTCYLAISKWKRTGKTTSQKVRLKLTLFITITSTNTSILLTNNYNN